MKQLKANLITPSGAAEFVWDNSFSSVFLDFFETGNSGNGIKLKIQCDGRVFRCDPMTDEVIDELR